LEEFKYSCHCSPVEARVCVADVAATERQLAEIVKEEEELEQISKYAQAEEGNEHSEEWLKFFSQEDERRRLQHWSL
jgi:hypothetical protein